jgi:hypothetical protein
MRKILSLSVIEKHRRKIFRKHAFFVISNKIEFNYLIHTLGVFIKKYVNGR